MKKLTALLLVFIIALGLAACKSGGGGAQDDGKDPVTGVWKAVEADYNGTVMPLEDFAADAAMNEGYTVVFTVNEDGTFTDEESADDAGPYISNGTWTKTGDIYTFTIDTDSVDMEIRDGRLETTEPIGWLEARLIFEKQ